MFCQGPKNKSDLATIFAFLKKAFLQNAQDISAINRSSFYSLLVGKIPLGGDSSDAGNKESLLGSIY